MILAETLLDFISPLFLLSPQDRWSREQLSGRGFEYFCEGLDETWLRLREPAAILIDTRDGDGLDRFIASARRRGIPVISIQDFGLNPLPSDLVIDGSLVPDFSHPEFPYGARAFGGPDFMVLDPAFGKLHQKPKQICKTMQSVVINLGGGDARKFYPRILGGLKLWAQEVEAVGMRGFVPWGQERLEQRNWHPVRFRWDSGSADRLLSKADLAITAGGLSAYEALCAGTPLLALSYDSFQATTIRAMAAAGACIDLGPGDRLDPGRLAGVLSDLACDDSERRRISRNGRKLVDGRGDERVSRLIRQTIGERSGMADREFVE